MKKTLLSLTMEPSLGELLLSTSSKLKITREYRFMAWRTRDAET